MIRKAFSPSFLLLFPLLGIATLSSVAGCDPQPPGASLDGETAIVVSTRTVASVTAGATKPAQAIRELPDSIATLEGISNKGNLLVRVWEGDKNASVGEVFYQYDVEKGSIKKIVEPSNPGLVIDSVTVFDSWLLWVETRPTLEGFGWKLHLKNLDSEVDRVVAQDDLDIPEKTILTSVTPSPSMNESYVAWSQFTKNGDTFDSQIFLYDLRSQDKKTIAKVARGGWDSLVKTPRLSGRLVVWTSQAIDRANLVAHSDVHLLDIETGEERLLTENGKSFSPVISGDFVVWQYRSTPEDVYGEIELYDLSDNSLVKLQTAKHAQEFRGPSIGSRVVTWQRSMGDKAIVYDLSSKKSIELDSGFINKVLTNANTVAWQWRPRGDRVSPLDWRIRFVVLP